MKNQKTKTCHIEHNINVPYSAPGVIDSFWHHAELTHTYERSHSRNKYKRCQYDIEFGRGNFRRRRVYKNPITGEVRETIEIDRTTIG